METPVIGSPFFTRTLPAIWRPAAATSILKMRLRVLAWSLAQRWRSWLVSHWPRLPSGALGSSQVASRTAHSKVNTC
jgi:hypothetical protein